MDILKTANAVLRFLLELCVLAALAYWGFQVGRGLIVKIGLGIGAPLLAALVWGTFVAPRAQVMVSEPLRLVIELLVFGVAIAALAFAGQRKLAGALALVYIINRILMAVWGQ